MVPLLSFKRRYHALSSMRQRHIPASLIPVCRSQITPLSVVANVARNYRFTTFERCEDPIEVIKSDGTKQRFDRNKLLVGLMRATIKRDIDTKKLNEIVDDTEVELRSHTDGRHVP